MCITSYFWTNFYWDNYYNSAFVKTKNGSSNSTKTENEIRKYQLETSVFPKSVLILHELFAYCLLQQSMTVDQLLLKHCMMYASWDMKFNRNFLSFWAVICPLILLTNQKIKIFKKWKNAWRYYNLHLWTANEDHMM